MFHTILYQTNYLIFFLLYFQIKIFKYLLYSLCVRLFTKQNLSFAVSLLKFDL